MGQGRHHPLRSGLDAGCQVRFLRPDVLVEQVYRGVADSMARDEGSRERKFNVSHVTRTAILLATSKKGPYERPIRKTRTEDSPWHLGQPLSRRPCSPFL